MDRVSSEIRSKIMASVGTSSTGPEKAVRSIVHRLGYRYSLRRDELPGKPDLVFVSRKKVVFVHGCFWHGHSCKFGRLPKSRLEYWGPKISKNKARDRLRVTQLKRKGWSALTIWQCQIANRTAVEIRVRHFLDA